MKDEIKEILEDLRNKNMSVDDLTHNDKTKLLDYITNLQEENKRLKELDENYPIEEQLEDALKWKNIYKSRIDKAIEYIEHENFKRTLLGFSENKYLKNIQKGLLNILQGEDKNVKD